MTLMYVKLVLISTGILSMAMGLKLTVPVVSDFIISEAPSMWAFFLSCFTPPYLYILVNFIILTIVASSKLHHSPPEIPILPSDPVIYAAPYGDSLAGHIPAPEPVKISGAAQPEFNTAVSDLYVYEAKTTPSEDVVAEDKASESYVYEEKAKVNQNDAVVAPRKDSMEYAFSDENERPPVSARFNHRKAVRANPEGGKVVALGVAKPKRQDTLESTWKTITEGRAMPLTRHLKKSDTWDSQQRRIVTPLADSNGGSATPVMKKSETFSVREKSASPGSGGRLRKEPSLSQDELNRRVEAFINKFNMEMRLQRQESLRQYREMINRRAR